MARHRLRGGRDVIEWLTKLGRTLGYQVETEWEVPDPAGRTDVDIAWLRRADDAAPLFLFEVESRPGSQLAENAQKVLSVPTSVMPKPVFFFQLVLTGGGGRAARSARAHEAANYGVFELAQDGAADAFMGTLLRQHGRLSSRVASETLWLCLRDSQALPVDMLGTFAVAEQTATDLDWTYEYALLATQDPAFHEPLARRLAAVLDGEAELAGAEPPPDGWWSWWWGAPLRLGVLAYLRPERAKDCVAALAHWQSNPSDPARQPMYGPYFGLSRDYDNEVLFAGPYILALIAALCAHVPEGPEWACETLATVALDERLDATAAAVPLVWLLHMALAYRVDALAVASMARIDEGGGLAPAVLLDPPLHGPEADDKAGWEQWREELGARRTRVGVAELRGHIERRSRRPVVSPLQIALQWLVHGASSDDGRQLRDWMVWRARRT